MHNRWKWKRRSKVSYMFLKKGWERVDGAAGDEPSWDSHRYGIAFSPKNIGRKTEDKKKSTVYRRATFQYQHSSGLMVINRPTKPTNENEKYKHNTWRVELLRWSTSFLSLLDKHCQKHVGMNKLTWIRLNFFSASFRESGFAIARRLLHDHFLSKNEGFLYLDFFFFVSLQLLTKWCRFYITTTRRQFWLVMLL